MGGERVTEEEIRDMERRNAWEEAARAAQTRVAPVEEPAYSRGVESLPDAPKDDAGGAQPPGASSPVPSQYIKPKNPVGMGPGMGSLPEAFGVKPPETPAVDVQTNPDPAASSPTSAAPKTPEETRDKAKEWGGESAAAPAGGEAGRDGGELPPVHSSPGVLIPGGMQPFTQKRDAKYGKEVALGVREAYGAAGGLEMEAAAHEHNANEMLTQQAQQAAMAKVAANETAAAQQQRLGEERDRMVNARLTEIESLNKQAQGDPSELWSSPVVLGRLVGALFLTLGTVSMATGGKSGVAPGIAMAMGGKFIDGLINQDIQTKIDQRNQAGKQAQRQTNLLHLHEERMKDQSKAIEATRLAYYDNIMQQMEAYRADPSHEVNEAAYQRLQADILKRRADTVNSLGKQEQADVTDELVKKFRPPQVIGGGPVGAHLKDVPNTITLSDRTTWALDDSPTAQKARERIIAMQKLQEVNDRIKKLRHETYKLSAVPGGEGNPKYVENMALLEDLGSQKAPLMSMALDGSTIRKDEREEIERTNIKATEGLGIIKGNVPYWTEAQRRAADATLDQQQSLWAANQKTEAAAAGGRRVQRGYVHDEHGEKSPVARYTGQDAAPAEHLAPNGFKSDDPKKTVTTRGPSLGETTPKSPDFGEQKHEQAAGKKKKKKDE